MFVNDRRARRSRWPTDGYFTYEKSLDNRTALAYRAFVYRDHQFDNVTLTDATEFIVYHSFSTSRHFFDRLFPENRTVLFTNPSLFVIGNTSIVEQSGRRFHLENVREAMLNDEGSFFFDTKTQTLFYHPKRNETMFTTTIILPILETVVSLIDVKQMQWTSLGIEHSAWMGSSTMNRSLPIDGRAAADYLDRKFNAVYLRNASDIHFDHVRLAHTAGYALQIDRFSREIRIENCQIFDLGAGGIRTGGRLIGEQEGTENITIRNCSLFDGGHLFPMGVAILLQRGTKGHLITQNSIDHFFHTAIHIGWSW